MPSKKKKKFISKKDSVSFFLGHRSQRDPLIADDEAPSRVLIPSDLAKQHEEQKKFGVYFEDDYDYMQHLKDVNELNQVEPILGDVLLETNNGSAPSHSQSQAANIVIPSRVFGSTAETKVGMLGKAAPIYGPRPDLDPDIIAALDDHFPAEDSEQLEDDFITLANAPDIGSGESSLGAKSILFGDAGRGLGTRNRFLGSISEEESERDSESEERGENADSECGGGRESVPSEFSFDEEETRSRFTSYSLTSANLPRNEALSLLDQQFEQFYEEYDEEEIGDLDEDDGGGEVGDGTGAATGGPRPHECKRLMELVEEFEQNKCLTSLAHHKVNVDHTASADADAASTNQTVPSSSHDHVIQRYLRLEEEVQQEEDETFIDLLVDETPKDHQRWDCESILSTNSTLYNHPSKIRDYLPSKSGGRRSKKTSESSSTVPPPLPPSLGYQQIKLDLDSSARHSASSSSAIGTQSHHSRSKNETLHEKRQRKQNVKAERRDRRIEKKANKVAFRAEKIKQESEFVNQHKNTTFVKVS